MTRRERIKLALAHRRPDRLPRYEVFFPAFIKQWRTAKGLPGDADIYSHYRRIDIGGILASQEGPFTSGMESWENSRNRFVRDSWGRLTRHSKGDKLFEVLETAVTQKSDLDSLVFEDPAHPGRTDVARLSANVAAHGKRFAPVSGVMGLFMPAYYLRGELSFLMDLVDDEAFCHELVGRVADFIGELGERVLAATDTWDTALWVYDDFGSNAGPLISPTAFERFFLPPYKRMISRWKAKGAQNIILHYDANCWPILDLLVEAGFTGIQGIYPGANMSIPAVKARYGTKLALIGGMCNITVLAPGPEAEIEREVAEIAEVAQDGGVVIGAHSIEEDIPVAHYDFYSRAVDRLGENW